MTGEHIRGIPRTYEKEITLADTPYTLSLGYNCVKVDTTGGNVRVNLPDVNYPIDVIKTSSDAYIVTIWVSGTQIGEVAGELSVVTVENGEVTADEPWYPYDAIVGIAGVSGDGGEVLAKDRFGRVIAGGRGVAGTNDAAVCNTALALGGSTEFFGDLKLNLPLLPVENGHIITHGELKICDAITSLLTNDAIIGTPTLEVADGSIFLVGMHAVVTDNSKGTFNGKHNANGGIITDITGNTITIDTNLPASYSVAQNGIVTCCNPVFYLPSVDNVSISGVNSGSLNGNFVNQHPCYALDPVRGETAYDTGISSVGSNNIRIRDLSIHHFSGNGISLEWGDYHVIRDVIAYSNNDKNIAIHGSSGGTFSTGHSISGCKTYLSTYEDGIMFHHYVSDSVISDCISYSNTRYGYMTGTGCKNIQFIGCKALLNNVGLQLGFSGQPVNDIVVIGGEYSNNVANAIIVKTSQKCVIDDILSAANGGSPAVHFDGGSYCRLVNSRIIDNQQIGVGVSGDYNSILNSTISGNGKLANDTHANVMVWGTPTNITISGNTIHKGSTGNLSKYGIYIQGGIVFVRDNILTNSGSTIIYGLSNITCHNIGYIAPGEVRTASGSLTAGNANAVAFAWHNPELQDVLIKKVTIRITTPGGTAGSLLDVGIADDATGTNLGAEFFDDLDLNTAVTSDQDITAVLCQDSVSATDGWVVGKILAQNAGSLVGSYYIEYMGA